MREASIPTRHELPRHAVRRFDQAVRLRADAGVLWLTIDGHPDDIELVPGETYHHDGHAPLLVSPLGGAAVLSVSPGARRSLAQRVRGWLHGAPAAGAARPRWA